VLGRRLITLAIRSGCAAAANRAAARRLSLSVEARALFVFIGADPVTGWPSGRSISTCGYLGKPRAWTSDTRARAGLPRRRLRATRPMEEDMSTQTSAGSETEASRAATRALRLEVTVLPVTDVDRAKAFYERLGWRLDADFPLGGGDRIVQFTPPASPASIQFGAGITTMTAPLENLYLVVDDLEAAREELISRGAQVTEIWHGRGVGADGHEPGRDPERASYGSFASFADPDGNRYLLQEITERLPGRVW
jgi:catechol 2,3-dioxygenase-like lactoylglutathione lyase family enzyme